MRLAFVLAAASTFVALVVSCSDQENPTFPPPPPPGSDGGAEADTDGGNTTVTGDPSKGVLLEGTILGETGPIEGQILTLPSGTIGCLAPGKGCDEQATAAGAARVVTDGVIAPGLIDTHNHILFDIFDNSDWLPSKLYQNHDDWTLNSNEPRYTVMVDVKQCLEDASQGKPTWCPTKFDGAGNLKCEMEKWGELKALAAGTTAVVGLAGTASPCFGSLARSIDTQYAGPGITEDKVQTAAIFPSKATADGVCANYANGKTAAYLIHVGEGLDTNARDEWTDLGTLTTTPGCLYAPQTAITHGTAFTATEFAAMKAKNMKLTWSPASNMALYGQTTNIPLALDNGLVISLAPDWSMGGSQNLLDELRFAKAHSDSKFGGRLTAKDLVEMATKNAAIILGMQDKIGTLKQGHLADLFVIKGDKAKPYDAVVSGAAKDVVLTMVGGKVLYGDASLRALGGGCEDFDACGSPKFLCVPEPGKTTDKLNQTYAQIRDALEGAMKDIDAVRPAIGGNFSPVAPVVGCPK
ncbi:MAG: amidohydrolase family protein [Deltaproteobacteria bacterium]|nr:amidohydrolase family protein [Deltaproteobacteria bacterium]